MCEHMNLQETSLDGVESTHSGQTSAADWYEEQERRIIKCPFLQLRKPGDRKCMLTCEGGKGVKRGRAVVGKYCSELLKASLGETISSRTWHTTGRTWPARGRGV